MGKSKGPLEEPGYEWFVNRNQVLDALWKWCTGIPNPGSDSWALIGLRRTGKTAIIHKTFNRLFNEQKEIIPIYISFARYLYRAEPITAYEFAREYFLGIVRSYLAFRYTMPELHREKKEWESLYEIAQEKSDETVLEWFRVYELESKTKFVPAHSIMQWVINFVKGYAWKSEKYMVIFIDEFQVLTRVYNPESDMMRKLTDSFQHAAETRYAPLVVSGSSVSMMTGEALDGMLSGRFQTWELEPLEEAFATNLVTKIGQALNILVSDELALDIYDKTNGYPYSIERIFKSRSSALDRFPDLKALDDVISFELTEKLGELRRHYEREYGKYIQELNGDGTTRKILLWITNYPGEHLNPSRVAETLALDVVQVEQALNKFYQLDILERASIDTYWGPKDPLLLKYIRHQHYLKIDNLRPQDAQAKLRREINQMRGEMNRQTGHFTEVIVSGVMQNFRNLKVEGEVYFSTPGTIRLPHMNNIRRREGVIKEGVPYEIDVVGEYNLKFIDESNADLGVWYVSVRYRKERMNEKEVEAFIKQVDMVQQERQYGEVVRWYFSKAGFTEEAKERLRQEGIYFSDLDQFNELADLFGLLPLSM